MIVATEIWQVDSPKCYDSWTIVFPNAISRRAMYPSSLHKALVYTGLRSSSHTFDSHPGGGGENGFIWGLKPNI